MAASEYAGMTGAARLADDTRRRFLAEIASRVPIDRLVAVHLFTPIRQGGVETGVAIVAARLPEPEAPVATEPAEAPVPADMLPESSPDAIDGASAEVPLDVPGGEEQRDAATVDEGEFPEPAEPYVDGLPDDAQAASAPPDATPVAIDVACDPTDDAAGPVAAPDSTVEATDDAIAAPPDDDGDAIDADDGLDDGLDDALEETPPAPVRHTVFTARYRYTIKGPDRGKWDADVVEEADAPLVTVDAVVRGVQRRAGDAAEPDRLDAEAVTRLLGGPPFAR